MVKAEKFPKTIILSNGTFPVHKVPLDILKQAETVICCDGAANELIQNGFTPSVIIGDMDSISTENKEKYKNIIIEVASQDTNDQTKAVEWAIDNGYDEICILGATGKREDHTIGNIALLCTYMKKIKVCMISNYGIFTPIYKPTVFNSFTGQQVSIFSLIPDTIINSENLRYPLNHSQFKSWWMGTLNESLSQNFSLNFENGELIVFQSF